MNEGNKFHRSRLKMFSRLLKALEEVLFDAMPKTN